MPDADVKPPENVLFVCKLNPVTRDEDLRLIFSRFGKIVSVRCLCLTTSHSKECEEIKGGLTRFPQEKGL